ncbi:hypothetical protein ACS0TY_029255 [Phlomoides rotata]
MARVKHLRSRFNVFDQMIACSGVGWDRESNFVLAPMEKWREWRNVSHFTMNLSSCQTRLLTGTN